MPNPTLASTSTGPELSASFDNFGSDWSVVSFVVTPVGNTNIGWSQQSQPFQFFPIEVSLDQNGMSNVFFTDAYLDYGFQPPNPDLTVQTAYAAFLGQSLNAQGNNGYGYLSLGATDDSAFGAEYDIGTLEVLGTGGIHIVSSDAWGVDIAFLTNATAAGRNMIVGDGDVDIFDIADGQAWNFELQSGGSLSISDTTNVSSVSGSGTARTNGTLTADQGFSGGLVALFGGTVVLDSAMSGYMAGATNTTVHVTNSAVLTTTNPLLAAIYGTIQNATSSTSNYIIDGAVVGDMLLGGHSSTVSSTFATGTLTGDVFLRRGDDTFSGVTVTGTVDLGEGDDSYSGVDLSTGQTVIAGDGDDILVGTTGNDTLSGGDNNDVISGWFGTNDILTGGDGDDRFVFLQQGTGATVTDFGTGNDVIEISGLTADDLLLRLFSEVKDGQQTLTELSGAPTRGNGDRQTIDLMLEQNGANVTVSLLQGGFVIGGPGNPDLDLTLANTLVADVALDDFVFV